MLCINWIIKNKLKKKENNLKELGCCINGNTSTWKTGKKQYFWIILANCKYLKKLIN